MDFRKRLAHAMEQRQCTRAALAKELQVSVQAVGMVLSGDTRALTAENAAKAARFLRIDYYWLATGEGDMEPQQSWPAPIQRVSVDRFMRLGPKDQAYVEGKLVAAIEECEGLTPSKKDRVSAKSVTQNLVSSPARRKKTG